jgi:hypothetical protein
VLSGKYSKEGKNNTFKLVVLILQWAASSSQNAQYSKMGGE